MDDIRESLGRVYDLSIIADMSHYFGMNNIRDIDAQTIFLNQSAYINS